MSVWSDVYSPAALMNYAGTGMERYEYDAYGSPYILEPNFAADPDGTGSTCEDLRGVVRGGGADQWSVVSIQDSGLRIGERLPRRFAPRGQAPRNDAAVDSCFRRKDKRRGTIPKLGLRLPPFWQWCDVSHRTMPKRRGADEEMNIQSANGGQVSNKECRIGRYGFRIPQKKSGQASAE
jgi:hypothetical protein